MDYLKKGKELLESGKYSQALEYFMVAMEQDKLNAEACYWCAMANKQLNKDFDYRKNIFKALSINPDYVNALIEIGLTPKSAINKTKQQSDKNEVNDLIKNLPIGFSVSPTKRVLFASGNVIFHNKINIWCFAEKQYFTVGEHQYFSGMGARSVDWGNGSYDLFYWGISNDLTHGRDEDIQFFSEWGDHFSGNWRTLSWNEWDYLFTKRANAKKLFGFSRVLGVDGVVILPDNWLENKVEEIYDDASTWNEMESLGAAFLPTISCYYKHNFSEHYSTNIWAYQTCSHEHFCYRLRSGLFDIAKLDRKYQQLPVRLVKDVVDE